MYIYQVKVVFAQAHSVNELLSPIIIDGRTGREQREAGGEDFLLFVSVVRGQIVGK